MSSPDKDVNDTAPHEVKKLLGQDKLDKMGSHDERVGDAQKGELKRDDRPENADTAKEINQRNQPDDSEQYAHEDNAEARDSRRPYEDVITPESYDNDISEQVNRNPSE